MPTQPTPLAENHTACTNCGAAFAPERRAFCPECGQETHVAPPKVTEFLQQFGGAYLSTEGALWRTLKLLLLHPGEATAQYLAGRRKHFVLPLRLYLSVSLLLLLVLRFDGFSDGMLGLNHPGLRQAEQGDLQQLTVYLAPGDFRLGVIKGAFVCQGLPAWLCQQVRQRAAPDSRTFLRKARLANERVVANLGAVMFVLLPLFALCLKLVNRRHRWPYASHLVFALHLHAFWFIVLALVQLGMAHINTSAIGWSPQLWLGVGVMVGYTLLAGRRVYGGEAWLPRLGRGLLLSLMYTVLLGLTVPVAWLLALVL
jgi:uncharacterized membrane protein